MKLASLPIAYVPLVDAAPLIVARELGFAEAEGLDLDLIAAPSWSSVRDWLAFGRVDAAHLLSPVPVAMALGLGGVQTPVSAVSVLSVNGDVIGVSRALEEKLRGIGHGFPLDDPIAAADDLARVVGSELSFGVPFPFSMHSELLRYWAEASSLSKIELKVRTVPPPLMARALADGEIDAFCVGEPWGSVAVDTGVGALVLAGAAIWAFAPEKVLAVRTDWAETEPHLLSRLMRAVWKAGHWLEQPESRVTASEILSRPKFLDVSAELIDRALSGHLIATGRGEQRDLKNFLVFERGAASFPWRSQAQWIGQRIAAKHGLDLATAADRAAKVFRTDLYRHHLAGLGVDMPGASRKVEGSIRERTAVASASGRVILEADSFFDGTVFDPDAQ